MSSLHHFQRFWHSPLVWVAVLLIAGTILFKFSRPQASPYLKEIVQSSPLSLFSPEVHPSCVDEKKVSTALGSTFVFLRENYVPETKQLECSYQSETQIRGIPPVVRYFWRENYTQAEWNTLLSEQQPALGFQNLTQKDNLIAVHNLVPELAQTTLYHFANQRLLQISYTPVDANREKMIEDAIKLLELIEQP